MKRKVLEMSSHFCGVGLNLNAKYGHCELDRNVTITLQKYMTVSINKNGK